MNLPLSLYDFMAVLFPAVMVLAIVRREMPWLPLWQEGSYQLGSLAVMLVLAYLFGHVIVKFSERLVEKWRWSRRFFQKRSTPPRADQIAFPGQRTRIKYDRSTGQQLLQGLSEVYHMAISERHPGLFNLVFALVQDRLPKRDHFLAIALMMRSFVTIALVYAVFLACKLAVYTLLWHRYAGAGGGLAFFYDAALFVLNLLALPALLSIYHTNIYLADFLPYSTFLAWYREKVFTETIKRSEQVPVHL